MGAVYLAEHPMLGRQVAVKVLHATFAKASDVVGRFFNEAKAANAIGHPGIVDVLDVGSLPDGTPYLIMELLRGENLATRLERVGRLPVAAALDLAQQAASAVAAAHAAGIVHRDLKPANLFLSASREDPTRTRLKVLDFGIAKLAEPLSGHQVKTGTGAILGTPAYMSPEQSLGRSSGIDHRTDIYSLGVILYHALAGAPPFMAEGFGEMMMLHMTAAPPSLLGRHPEVTAEVEAIVLRALAKKPDDRFQSMEELGRALAEPGRFPAAPAAREISARAEPPTVRLEPPLARTVRLSGADPISEVPAPSPASGLHATTLSSTAGQVAEARTMRTRRARWPLVVVGMLAVGGGGVAAVMLAGPGGGKTGGSVMPAVRPAEVETLAAPGLPAPIPTVPAIEPAQEPAAPPVPPPQAAAPAAESPVAAAAEPAKPAPGRRTRRSRERDAVPQLPTRSQPISNSPGSSDQEGTKDPSFVPPAPSQPPTPDAAAGSAGKAPRKTMPRW